MFRPKKDILLVPEQSEALVGIVESLDKDGVALDISKPGAGKTLEALAAARKLEEKYAYLGKKFVKFVIQPATQKEAYAPGSRKNTVSNDSDSLSPWLKECTEYGELDTYHSITYEKLRSVENSSAKLPVYINLGGEDSTILNEIPPGAVFDWYSDREQMLYDDTSSKFSAPTPENKYSSWDINALIYTKYVKGSDGKYTGYASPTKKFMQLPSEVTLMIIVDEFHNIKNDSAQAKALACAFRVIMRARRANIPAFIILLSGTPLQKPEHGINYMGIMGTHEPVENEIMFVSTTVPSPDQCYAEARNYDPELAMRIGLESKLINTARNGFNLLGNEASKKVMVRFWKECIAPKISHFVPTPSYGQTFTLMLDITDPNDIHLLAQADALLIKAEEQKEENKAFKGIKKAGTKIPKGESYFALRSQAQGLTERAMLNAVCKDAMSRIEADPLCKIFVCLRRIDNVEILLNMFPRQYKLAKFVGEDMNIAAKESIKRDFQMRDSVRGIIGTIQSMAVGINFQDIIGGRQIISYITNDDDVVLVEQAVKRTDRRDSQSFPISLVFYPLSLGHTMSVYQGSIMKSENSREMMESRRKLLSEETDIEKKRDLYNTISPGEYNRAIQFRDVGIIYLLDRPYFHVEYDQETGKPLSYEYVPSEPGSWGFIGYEDNLVNREAYKVENTSQLINFLQRVIDQGKINLALPVNEVYFSAGAAELQKYLLGYWPHELRDPENSEDISSDLGKIVLEDPTTMETATVLLSQLILPGKTPVYLTRMVGALPGIRLATIVGPNKNPAPLLSKGLKPLQ